MKNVAICISGSLRSLEHCKNSIIANIIKPNNKKYNLKLFFYLPNDINSQKIKLMNDYDPEVLIENDIILKSPNIIWGGRPTSQKIDNESTAGIQGYLQQLYGIEKNYELVINYEKRNNIIFDVILRIRSDVIFKNPIYITSYNLDKITVPLFHSWSGINDRFAIGNRKIMKYYMHMYQNFYKIAQFLYNKYNRLPIIRNAETFCLLNLQLNKVPYIQDNNILFNRVRKGGIIKKDCF